jgi:hypothetical protein
MGFKEKEKRQLLMPIVYDQLNIQDAYRIDLLVEKQLVEIKLWKDLPRSISSS